MSTPLAEPLLSDHPDPQVLLGSMFDFANPTGPDLLTRTEGFEAWRRARSAAGVWPFSRVLHAAPGPEMEISDERGLGGLGVSLACQDYLGLTAHPAIREAAVKALHDFGPHSAGSPALAGNTVLSLELERAIGEALGFEHVALFPTGWAAGYASIAGLIRPDDHIVMDQLSHACLQQGALASTRNIHRHAHLNAAAVRELLQKIRRQDARNGILVITEGLFSMDSDVPDLQALQAACREFGATLLVDVAHDFGSMGPGGGGSLALQDLVGQVDLVMGSFSKTFCSNGGFLATRSEAVRQYMKFYGSPQTFSNALSPIQTAVVLEALRIVRSNEGNVLRAALLRNAEILREALGTEGIRCIGMPSAIVPAHIGDEAVGRIAWSRAHTRGVHVNLVEFPAVADGSARFRMQVMASHKPEQLLHAVKVVAETLAEAREEVARLDLPKRSRFRQSPAVQEVGTTARALPALLPDDLPKLLRFARLAKHLAGETVIRAGESLDALYVLQKGEVRIELEQLGQAVPVALCGAGEILGEMSMLDGKGASASVVAETDVELACIDHAVLARLGETDPALGMRLYRSLALVLDERLRARNAPISPFEFIG